MSNEERLDDLLLAWEERFQQGEDLPADELCQDWPKLVEPLAERIASLKRMAWVGKKGQLEKESKPDGESQKSVIPENKTDSFLHEGAEPVRDYWLIKKLGRGAFGEVWSASSPESVVAMKFFHGMPALERITQEHLVRLELNGLTKIRDARHPSVLEIYDLIISNGSLVLITELANCSLDAVFRELRYGLPLLNRCAYALYWLRNVAEALDCLRDKHDLMHLDIKPSNLLVKNDEVKVGDFGTVSNLKSRQFHYNGVVLFSPSNCDPNEFVATSFVSSDDVPWQKAMSPKATLFTAAGVITPRYAPPEAFCGKFSRSFDQYSLALTFCELVSDIMPFSQNYHTQIEDKKKGRMELDFLPEALRPIIRKSLSPRPEDRFTSCVEFVNVMQDAFWPLMPTTANDGARVLMSDLSSTTADCQLPTLEYMRNHRGQYTAINCDRPESEHMLYGYDKFWSYGLPMIPNAYLDGLELDRKAGAEEIRKAIHDISKLICLIPDDAWAFCRRGMGYERFGEYDLAIKDFSKAIALDSWMAGYFYYRRGKCHFSDGNDASAFADFDQGMAHSPNDSFIPSFLFDFHLRYLYDRGRACLEKSEYRNAIEYFTTLIQIVSTDKWLVMCGGSKNQHSLLVKTYNKRGAAYFGTMEYQQAIADFTKSIELDPLDADAYRLRAKAYKAVGSCDECSKDVERANQFAEPNEHKTDEEARESKNEFKRSALVEEPGKAILHDSCLALARAYHAKNDLDRAIAVASEAIRLYPTKDWGYCVRAELYWCRNEFDLAIADATEAIRLYDIDRSSAFSGKPRHALAFVIRVAAYWLKGAYDHAIADSREAIWFNVRDQGNPDLGRCYGIRVEAFCYGVRAAVYCGKNELNLAIANANKAIQLDPNSSFAYEIRAGAYLRKGDCSRFLADSSQANKLRTPGVVNAISLGDRPNGIHLGFYPRLHVDLIECDKPFCFADNALKKDNDDLIVLNEKTPPAKEQLADGIGNIHIKVFDSSGQATTSGLFPLSFYATFYANRGRHYSGLREYRRAIEDLDRAIRLVPDFGWAYAQRGYVYNETAQYGRAIEDLDLAIYLNPDEGLAIGGLEFGGRCYNSPGDYGRAIEDLNRAIRLNEVGASGDRIRLRGVNGDVDGKIWEFSSSLRAGRLHTLEMPLEDSSVSRRHAEIRPTANGWLIKDLGSTNGTFINGTRLDTSEYPIRAHDIIRFGNFTFVVDLLSLLETGVCKAGGMPLPFLPWPRLGKRLWQVTIPGNRPLATPAISDNTVFVGGGFGSHQFYGFAADTGEQLWQYHTEDDGPSAAIVLDDLVAFNTESCEIEVLTVDGKPVWKKWLGDPLMSMPAAANGRLFTIYPNSQGDRRYYLACFQMQTGEMLWRKPVSADAITAPVLARENVYVTTQDGTIWCFRQSDGEAVWRRYRNATSAPTVLYETCYYSRRQPEHQNNKETVQWECLGTSRPDQACQDFYSTWCQADYLDYGKRRMHSDVETMSQTLDETVGFSTLKGHASIEMSQTNLGQGTVAGAWSYQGSRPCVYRNLLYSCVGRHVQCVNPSSGGIVWKTRVADGNQPLLDHLLTPPVTVNGKIIVATTTGELVCLCSVTGKWLWREIVGEPIRFQPAVACGRIYVATATGSLYCLETGDEKDHGWLMWGGTAAHNGINNS